MDRLLKLKLPMLGSTQDFLRAYPPGEGPAAEVVAAFMAKMDRVRGLVGQQQEGEIGRMAQVGKRNALRQRIASEPVRHLAKIALALLADHPEVADTLRQPIHSSGESEFLARVQAIEAAVTANQELLRTHGMAVEVLDGLRALIVEYQEAAAAANAAIRAHTGARAELRVLGRELMKVARQLDGIIMYRFRDNPELLGAWKSARNVAWPVGEPAAPVVPTIVSEGQRVK